MSRSERRQQGWKQNPVDLAWLAQNPVAFPFREGHSKRVIDPGVEAEIERATQMGARSTKQTAASAAKLHPDAEAAGRQSEPNPRHFASGTGGVMPGSFG